MRRGGAVIAATAACLALAGTADAATISGGSTPGPPGGIPLPLQITAAAGETNRIEVVGSGGGYIVRETGTTTLTNAAASCNATGNPREFLCSLVAPGQAAVTPIIFVALNDKDDTFRGASQPIPIVVDAGEGDDMLASGAGVQALLNGSGGSDTVDYSSHAQPVNVSLDNSANDGGAEDGGAENAQNVERIVGGASNDLLVGSTADNRIDGGAGADVLDGGAGADNLLGNVGNDQLSGGADGDAYDGGDGDDTLNASDGLGEDVACGAGNDTATVDVADRLLGCETVRRTDENRDGDGDGVVPPQDCNDGNPGIRPGARDVPRNGVDEDCSGSDAKRRTVASSVAYLFAFDTTYAQARRFTVNRVPKGGVVRLKCTRPKGNRRACPFTKQRRSFSRAKRKVSFLRAFKQRRLPVGTRIELRVTRKNWVGKVFRFRVRSDKIPRVRTRCVAPGKNKLRRC